jgi:hypothetical protein
MESRTGIFGLMPARPIGMPDKAVRLTPGDLPFPGR